MRSYLGQALASAERRGKVSRNVARLAEMPATPAPIEKRSLTPVQAKMFRGSRRPLKLPERVMDALRRHKRSQAEDRLRVGSAWHQSDLVFTTNIGTPIDPNNLRRSFRALTDKAGLPGHWVPNELRHSAATLMYEAGIPLEAIADILGHSNTRMLEKHYRHATGRVLDEHVAVMDRMFGNG